jgi:hypothetical protein
VNELEMNVKTMLTSLHDCINSVLPNTTQASFSLMTALIKIEKSQRQGKHLESINVLKDKEASFDDGCLCSYICQNAETAMQYHQESEIIDSSSNGIWMIWIVH